MHHSVVHHLGDLLGDELLDSVVQLRGKANARAVDLAQDEAVLLVLGPIKDEVGAPYQWSRQVTEPVPDLREGQLEILHQVRPLVGLVVGVLSTGEQSSGEALSSLSGLLVHHENGSSTDQQDADLALLDSGQERHIDQLSILADDVLLAKVHKLAELTLLDVVVDGLSALQLGVERKRGAGDGLFGMNKAHSPDT